MGNNNEDEEKFEILKDDPAMIAAAVVAAIPIYTIMLAIIVTLDNKNSCASDIQDDDYLDLKDKKYIEYEMEEPIIEEYPTTVEIEGPSLKLR